MVRFANELDILQLAVLAEAYSNEAKNHDLFPFDLDLSIKNVSMSMTCDSNYLSVLVEDNSVIGFMWAVASQLPWSSAIIVFDNIFYITPERRGGYGIFSIIKHYEAWCKSIGAVACSLSTASGINTDRVCNLFQHLGYSNLGVQFRKEL